MKKLSIALILATLAGVGSLAACGDDTSSGSDGDGTTSGSPSGTTGGNGGCQKATDCSAINCDGTEYRGCVNGVCQTSCPQS